MGTLGGIGELAREAFGDGTRQCPAVRQPKQAAGTSERPRRPRSKVDASGIEPGWLWVIGGVVLLIAELIAPGFFLVFIGAAAIADRVFHPAVRPRPFRHSSPCSRFTRSSR